jgi:hypothetical protein
LSIKNETIMPKEQEELDMSAWELHFFRVCAEGETKEGDARQAASAGISL